MKYHTIIFDLDGTLLDTLDDLADSMNAVLSQNGYPVREREEIRRFVGNGVGLLVERALPSDVSKQQQETCLVEFREHYNKNMKNKTKLYDGILTVLQELKKKEIKMAVVSNKYDLAVKNLIGEWFPGLISKELAIGEREGIRKKPAPDSVLEALRLLKSEKEGSIYIGDSDVDIQTAENAGLFSVGVTWGFRDRKILQEAGAKKILDRPSQILELF